MGAGQTRALVDVYSAVRSCETRGAGAPVPVDAVSAGATVEAGLSLAVIHVSSAVGTFEALATYALVSTVGAVDAGCAVFTGRGGTGRRGDVAGSSLPAWWAVTGEAVSAVLAGSTVSAGSRFTVTTSQSAGLALPAIPADTGEVGDAVYAGAVVPAGAVGTLVYI